MTSLPPRLLVHSTLHRFLPRLGAQIMQALEKARASFTQLDIIWLDAPFGHPVYARQQAPSGAGASGEAQAASAPQAENFSGSPLEGENARKCEEI